MDPVGAVGEKLEALGIISADIVSVYPEEEKRLSDQAKQEKLKQLTVAKETKKAKLLMILTPLVLSVVIGGILALMTFVYYDLAWDPFAHYHRLKISIINDDSQVTFYGQNISLGDQILSGIVSSDLFTFQVLPPSSTEPQNQSAEVVLSSLIKQGKIWGGVHIPAHFTEVFLKYYYAPAGSGVNASSTYPNVISFLQDPTQQYSVSTAVSGAFSSVFEAINAAFQAKIYAGKFGAHSPNAPFDVVYSPVRMTTINIHILEHNGWYLGPYMCFIFMWLMTIMAINVTFGNLGRNFMNHILPFHTAIECRYGTMILIDMNLAWVLVAVVHHFAIPAYHSYAAMFGLFYLTLLAYSGMFYILYGILGQFSMLFSIILLYLQMLTCGGMASYDLLPKGWDGIGACLPMQHGLALLRYVCFDTLTTGHSEHLGVLFAWAIGGHLLALIPQWFGFNDPVMKKARECHWLGVKRTNVVTPK